MVGSVQPILVEGISKKQSSGSSEPHHNQLFSGHGRTSTNKIVNFYYQRQSAELR